MERKGLKACLIDAKLQAERGENKQGNTGVEKFPWRRCRGSSQCKTPQRNRVGGVLTRGQQIQHLELLVMCELRVGRQGDRRQVTTDWEVQISDTYSQTAPTTTLDWTIGAQNRAGHWTWTARVRVVCYHFEPAAQLELTPQCRRLPPALRGSGCV